MTREQLELEKLIAEGLIIDARDYWTIQNWIYSAYVALTRSIQVGVNLDQADLRQVEHACFNDYVRPIERVEVGLKILNEALDRLKYLAHERLCIINCE